MSTKQLLFLHTGGTLGMTQSQPPGPLEPAIYDQDVLPYVRGLDEIATIEGRVVFNLDSSDLTPEHWETLGRQVFEARDDFDGIVILHGTDTMAYTACALSFMLSNLNMPVVLTGSQRPIAELRTDARTNLIHSALCATMPLAEVGLYFGRHLFRGNRSTKVSIQSYDAFHSPNYPPLIDIGIDVVQRSVPITSTGTPTLQTGFDSNVAVLSMIPGLAPRLLDATVDAGAKVVLLRAFGEGNVPQEGWPQAIARANKSGTEVIVLSQCRTGNVQPGRYEGSDRARAAGALFGGDMTGEAATVKAMWLLGQGKHGEDFRAAFNTPIAGECTVP